MTKRIFRSICLVAVAVFIASFVLIMGVLYGYFSDVQQNQLKTQTMLAAQGVSHEGIDYFDRLEVRNFRITWIEKLYMIPCQIHHRWKIIWNVRRLKRPFQMVMARADGIP